MPKTTPAKGSWLQAVAVRAARVHFGYMGIYIVAIVIFDSWNLLAHVAVSERWTAAGTLFGLNTIIWYVARMKLPADYYYKAMVVILVLADIVFAGFNVFWERGYASKSVALFAIPLLTVAALRSRSAVLAAFSLSIVAYSVAVIRYFNFHYGEGYRVELYGDLFFYGGLFLVIVYLLFIIIRPTSGTS